MRETHVAKLTWGFASAALSLGLVACSEDKAHGPKAAPLLAKGFTISLNPAPGRPAAAYGTITGPAQTMLTEASSAEAGRVELHVIERQGEVARMKRVDGLLIDSTGALTLEKGGAHLMLFDVAPSAGDDGKVPLSLTFDDGTKLAVEAKLGS